MIRMLVRSEWAEATLPSRVAPQEINLCCFVMTSSCPSKSVFAGTGAFLIHISTPVILTIGGTGLLIWHTLLAAAKSRGRKTVHERRTTAMEYYRTYLTEEELPTHYYNLRADMEKKPAPLLRPRTMQPMTAEELEGVFCAELVKQELDNDTRFFEIPEEIRDYYKTFRPSPLVRAYNLEKALGTPAKIYFKFEGNNTSGSHKLNSAAAQAYYARKQGLKGVTTETGAGQWGTALSMACAYFGLDCKVYMVKTSYEQKPFRREVMRTYGAEVTASPSDTEGSRKKITRRVPGTGGSLGCAISEAVEAAVTRETVTDTSSEAF